MNGARRYIRSTQPVLGRFRCIWAADRHVILRLSPYVTLSCEPGRLADKDTAKLSAESV
jgi:hypothetical protein